MQRVAAIEGFHCIYRCTFRALLKLDWHCTVTAKSVPPKTGPGGTNFGSKNVPPGLVLIAKIGLTLPKMVYQSFGSTDKLTWPLWMKWCINWHKDQIYERINYRSSTVNQACVKYSFLQYQRLLEFSTSLSICSQVSWYHCCLQPSPPHCTIPSRQRQLLNLSNDSNNTHRTTLFCLDV